MEVKDLYALMDKFEKSGLSELVYKKGGDEICLKKAQPSFLPSQPGMAPPIMALPTAGHVSTAPAGKDPQPVSGTEFICSPLVGTFYRAPGPDSPPFVEKGDTVKKGGPLCILEAMKLMNEYQAEFDMEIVSILADNGKMVEFGAPLFEVRRK